MEQTENIFSIMKLYDNCFSYERQKQDFLEGGGGGGEIVESFDDLFFNADKIGFPSSPKARAVPFKISIY